MFQDVRKTVLENSVLDSHKAQRAVHEKLQAFVEGNADPDKSSNFASQGIDDMTSMVAILTHPAVAFNATFTLLALTVRFQLEFVLRDLRWSAMSAELQLLFYQGTLKQCILIPKQCIHFELR